MRPGGVSTGVFRGRALAALLLALLLGLTCADLRAEKAKPKPPACADCHDNTPKLEKSVHAALTCETCHESHDQFPHPENIPKPSCAACHQDEAADVGQSAHGMAQKNGADAASGCVMCHGDAHAVLPPQSPQFRAALADTCGACHKQEAEQYRGSVHGQALERGVTEAPLCIDCHGGHKIVKRTDAASPVRQGNIRETCGSCHGDVRLARKFGMPTDRLVSFDSSFHGLAAKAGSQTVASCASCHGVHNILPSSDPNSTINPKNLSMTCGRCHPGAGARFAISQVHLVEGRSEPAGIRWVRGIYMVLIPLTIGLMLLHHGGDWIRKLIRARFAASAVTSASLAQAPAGVRRGELRMLPFERILHAGLAISFLTLAWTGFALKYPDQWWAQPLVLLEGTLPVRSLIHRIAAVVFLATAAAHVASLILNQRLRNHWRALLPSFADVREGWENFRYNLGLRARPPARSSHSYLEKVEYVALVWGTIIMAATGIPLWANNLALRLLPKVWLDVATSVHFYEAVLATAAIVVWHFYSVIFDPDVYPLDTAFLTGFSSRKPELPAAPSSGEHSGE